MIGQHIVFTFVFILVCLCVVLSICYKNTKLTFLLFITFFTFLYFSFINYMLVNMSFADMLVLVVCLPSGMLDIYSKSAWYLGATMCKYIHMQDGYAIHLP